MTNTDKNEVTDVRILEEAEIDNIAGAFPPLAWAVGVAGRCVASKACRTAAAGAATLAVTAVAGYVANRENNIISE